MPRRDPSAPTSEAATPSSHLTVVQWRDPLVESCGYEMRGVYVERFWLPVLGPTCTLLLRRVADMFDAHPDGFTVDMHDLGAQLGVAFNDSAHNALSRAFLRCEMFGFSQRHTNRRDAGSHDSVAIRRVAPPLAQRHIKRLPASLVAMLEAWNESAQMPMRCANNSR